MRQDLKSEPIAALARWRRLPGWLTLLLPIVLFAPCGFAEEEGFDERLFRNGVSLLRAGKPAHALETFAELSRGFPNSPFADDALYQSGAHYYPRLGFEELHRSDRQSIARAMPYFLKIQENYTRGDMAPLALYKLGLIALEARNPDRNTDEAFARFSRLLTVYPGSPIVDRALLGTAHVQAAMGDCGLAMNHLDRLFTRHPNSSVFRDGLYLMAKCQADTGQWIPAMETLQDLIDRNGDGADAFRAKRFLTLIFRTRFLPSLRRELPLQRDLGFEKATAGAGLRGCGDLAVDGDGRVYLADSRLDSLWSFEADGGLIGRSARPAGIEWIGIRGDQGLLSGGKDSVHLRGGPGPLTAGEKALEDLHSVAITAEGTIYVADRKKSSILVFNDGLNHLRDLDPPGDGRLVRLRVGPRGELHALFDLPAALFRLGTDGAWTYIPLGEEFAAARPVDFSVDGLGNLYMLSRRGGPVLLYDRTGAPLRRLDLTTESGDPRLVASSIAVGPLGSIHLCNRKGDRIVRFH
jgi:TolA-binding protein